ncbi:MAG: thioesterase family protein [Sphingomonas sp.]|uniref:PaaI family thioesterase n=1 Tax=Sphingomonas sp. TaxID=28214 RepID=UPI001AC8111D|nr:hotdog domain-containing protein [Sphingomonas sp.]MBN8816511.1 thioesterase family protein [Sphingomonas sp.]
MTLDPHSAACMTTSGFSAKLGAMIDVAEAGAAWTLSPTPELIGNPIVPALHGGAVTAFLELASGIELARRLERDDLPRLISANVQFLASMRLERLIAFPRVVRVGRRVAVVHIQASQGHPATVVCAAQFEFFVAPT